MKLLQVAEHFDTHKDNKRSEEGPRRSNKKERKTKHDHKVKKRGRGRGGKLGRRAGSMSY